MGISNDLSCKPALYSPCLEQARAGKSKKLVVVADCHFQAYDGRGHGAFVPPHIARFKPWFRP
jgi:hypothetical protein